MVGFDRKFTELYPMAYDKLLADRIAVILQQKHVKYIEKKMFGGLCFMVDDKMCIGIIKDELMARIDPKEEATLLRKKASRKMDFTGRPMKGYLSIAPEGIDGDSNLQFWIERCLEFNPKAKSSKKKRKKKE